MMMASLGGLSQQQYLTRPCHRLHILHAHHALRSRPDLLHSVRSSALLCRSRPHSLQSVKRNVHMQAKALSSSNFFDRDVEQSLLLDQLKESPTNVLVIVGPRSSGKSRLLEEVLLKRHKALLGFVDGRAQKLTDAGIMTSALRKQAEEQLSEVRQQLTQLETFMGKATAVAAAGSDIIGKFVPGLDVKSLLEVYDSAAKQFKQSDTRSLNGVIEAYSSLLKLTSTIISQASPLPVICIDEANVLMEWHKGGTAMENDLDALLRFFVKMTKQSHRAHVILATSEYSFITWLTEKLGSKFFRVQVIGDFPEAEARLFLEQALGATIAGAEWADIFEVCGGNAGGLLSVVQDFKVLKTWTSALEEVWKNPMEAVSAGLLGAPGWSAAQYSAVVQCLVQAPHGAIVADDLYTKLGVDKRSAKAAVMAMVKANMLSYRPPSGWARDVPVEAFGPKKKKLAVVTAPSSAYLYCMRVFFEDGFLSSAELAAFNPPPESTTLQEQLKDVGKSINSGTEAASSTPTAAQEPSPLEQQIKSLEDEISTGKARMKVLSDTKPEGWGDELRYLRDLDKQLREEKRQLREEKLLLLRKSDT